MLPSTWPKRNIITMKAVLNLQSRCLWICCFEDQNKACENSQSVAAFKMTLVHRDWDKMPITLSVTAISLQLNGVKFAITSQQFVIIWILTVINWQGGKPVAGYICPSARLETERPPQIWHSCCRMTIYLPKTSFSCYFTETRCRLVAVSGTDWLRLTALAWNCLNL